MSARQRKVRMKTLKPQIDERFKHFDELNRYTKDLLREGRKFVAQVDQLQRRIDSLENGSRDNSDRAQGTRNAYNPTNANKNSHNRVSNTKSNHNENHDNRNDEHNVNEIRATTNLAHGDQDGNRVVENRVSENRNVENRRVESRTVEARAA